MRTEGLCGRKCVWEPGEVYWASVGLADDQAVGDAWENRDWDGGEPWGALLPQGMPGTTKVAEVVVTGHRLPPDNDDNDNNFGLPDFIQIASNGGPSRLNPNVQPNQVQNRQFRDAVKKAERMTGRKLSPAQQEILHDEITGEELGFDEIVEVAVEILLGIL